MNKKVLEMVMFRLQAGYEKETFLADIQPMYSFLRGCSGFIGRTLLYAGEQNQWIELVLWMSIEDARQTGAAVEASTDMMPLFKKLTEVTMIHLEHLALDIRSTQSFDAGMKPINEVILYKLKAGTNFNDYQGMLIKAGEMMGKKAGFVSRSVYFDAHTETWVEVLKYESREAADLLAGEVMASPEIQRIFAVIDEPSVKIWFAEEVLNG